MKAFWENRTYGGNLRVWVGCYENLRFLSHYHREIEMIYVREGTATLGIQNRIFSCQRGDLVICRSGCMHYSPPQQTDCVLDFLLFDPEILQEYRPILNRPLPPVLRAQQLADAGMDRRCTSLYETVNREILKKAPGYEAVVSGAILQFMAYCGRYFPIPENDEAKPEETQSPKIGRLLDYINAHYAESLTLPMAAKIMGYEPSYCSKVFKKLTGVGFSRYLNSVRIEHAIRYLREPEQTVTEIALRCGFNTIRNFNRTFRELTGVPPTRFSAMNHPLFGTGNRYPAPNITSAIVTYRREIAGEEYLHRYTAGCRK